MRPYKTYNRLIKVSMRFTMLEGCSPTTNLPEWTSVEQHIGGKDYYTKHSKYCGPLQL
jgi:hypothetical protein